ncbi:MAG TPA: DUF2332 family protein [Candidatus Dormibacteraeota bacterium]
MRQEHEVLAGRLRSQADGCTQLGSPFYGALLGAAARDLEADGPTWDLLAPFAAEPGTAALALRLMGAVHALVLEGALPELAAHYPSTGGDGDPAAAWPIFRQALSDQGATISQRLARGCQTNEVGRSAALLGGFLEAAHRSGLPLRILEVGASAGLNLRWDHYRYEALEGAWGDTASPVRFDHSFDVPPPLNRTAEVVERLGCDLEPIDATSEDGALRLRSFVWADQLSRLSLLDGAIQLAREVPAAVERIDAADFVARELAERRSGAAAVVYHSVFMQYLPAETRERLVSTVDEARRGAREGAPVYYLRMEPGDATFEIRLDDDLMGVCSAHGTGVVWLAS